MLNSFEIYQALNELGYRLEAGKFEPSYASEHALGNGKYLHVKRSRGGVVNKSSLVLAPETFALKAEIDRISGIHCLGEKVKSTSYRRYTSKLVAHGSRSIANNTMNEAEFNSDVIETALAHSYKTK